MRKVYRMTKAVFARDLSGTGAAKYGGRWNPKGTYVLYTASSAALSMLEWLAHVNERDMDEQYCLTTFLLPEESTKKITEKDLPPNWQNVPPPTTLAEIGRKFVEDGVFLVLEVPSVLVPYDHSLVINTQHSLFKQVKIESVININPDSRLYSKPT